ncbi:ribosomal biogenesis regulatory protein [Piedraia hortae CBS 480.64]|uniref:Ribosome biogenesis regulatory protein n=1 Tax=Piedraia hortae CBS 480.64 TaxID=1314780 RepID=A0A6A7BPG6_9PEZI|nr:ribosomal biogenesis regulatory protein [Piedraia hortae CBS 480.64]
MAETQAQPFVFDLGHLMVTDPNPLTSSTESDLEASARQCAQGIINKLLTSCPIERAGDGELSIKLPDPVTQLPREKPIPKPKEKTKWERFAEKKGIKPKRKSGKLVYSEEKKDWVPKYGYKGKDDGQADWLVEVDEKAERKQESEEIQNGNGKQTTKRKKQRRS